MMVNFLGMNSCHDIDQRQSDRIGQRALKLVGFEELDEVLENWLGPCTALDTQRQLVVFEGDLRSSDGHIAEHDNQPSQRSRPQTAGSACSGCRHWE